MASIYEPAALVAEKWGNGNIAYEIRALPNPPSEVPVFTAEDIGRYEDEYVARQFFAGQRRHHIAACINDRLATFRLVSARLAAEGFRLGDTPSTAAAPQNCTCHPDEAITPCPRLHAHSECAAHERAIQSRIDAAVLAEREACAQEAKSIWGYCLNGSQIAEAIRARTTIAQQLAAAKEDASGSASAAGESPAPLRKVVQVFSHHADGDPWGVVCDDGTFWKFGGSYGWELCDLPPIPQPGETT